MIICLRARVNAAPVLGDYSEDDLESTIGRTVVASFASRCLKLVSPELLLGMTVLASTSVFMGRFPSCLIGLGFCLSVPINELSFYRYLLSWAAGALFRATKI